MSLEFISQCDCSRRHGHKRGGASSCVRLGRRSPQGRAWMGLPVDMKKDVFQMKMERESERKGEPIKCHPTVHRISVCSVCLIVCVNVPRLS